MSPTVVQVLSQLVAQSPLLLAYVIGFAVALYHLERHPVPATLTLFGTGLLLFTTVVFAWLFHYLILERSRAGLSASQIGLVMSGVGLVSSLLHAIGMGLILAAVFAARGGAGAGRAKPPAGRLLD